MAVSWSRQATSLFMAIFMSSTVDADHVRVSHGPVRLRPRPITLETFLQHRHPDDPQRHIGRGRPLQGTSWRNRPFHVGWTFGGLLGDELIRGRAGQGNRVFGAYRLGWDFSHFWGSEVRFGFAYLEVIDDRTPPWPRDSRNRYYDIHMVHYPWGDAMWRPYVSFGLGIHSFRFRDRDLVPYDEVLLGMPIGIGIKYQRRHWLAWRADVTNNIAFGAAGVDTMNNVSLTGGVEMHFGGSRTSYHPWSPGTSFW